MTKMTDEGSPNATERISQDELNKLITKEVGKALDANIPRIVQEVESQVLNMVEIMMSSKMDELKEMVSGVQGKKDAQRCTYKEFMACKPSSYNGEIDPIECKRWISNIEGVFIRSHCEIEDQVDGDDDDIEKGDDCEHEEIFTDDDEAVGNDPEEREDLAPENPAPSEIKQICFYSQKVIEDESSPVLAPKANNNGGPSKHNNNPPNEEPIDNNPSKPAAATTSARGTPSSNKSAKGKRKRTEENKPSNGAATASKKVKTENDVKHVTEEPAKAGKGSSSKPAGAGVSSATGPVTEEEITAVLLQNAPVTTRDLVVKFKSRLRTKEDKTAFADILRRISKIQKTNGANYLVLRDR